MNLPVLLILSTWLWVLGFVERAVWFFVFLFHVDLITLVHPFYICFTDYSNLLDKTCCERNDYLVDITSSSVMFYPNIFCVSFWFTFINFFCRKSGKLKASKSLRNDVNLRQELQDFIFAAGLPSDAVPSFKELNLHGRWTCFFSFLSLHLEDLLTYYFWKKIITWKKNALLLYVLSIDLILEMYMFPLFYGFAFYFFVITTKWRGYLLIDIVEQVKATKHYHLLLFWITTNMVITSLFCFLSHTWSK